jgi:hypothetical protein
VCWSWGPAFQCSVLFPFGRSISAAKSFEFWVTTAICSEVRQVVLVAGGAVAGVAGVGVAAGALEVGAAAGLGFWDGGSVAKAADIAPRHINRPTAMRIETPLRNGLPRRGVLTILQRSPSLPWSLPAPRETPRSIKLFRADLTVAPQVIQ